MSEQISTTDLPTHLAAMRGREEHAEGWTFNECPYPDSGPMRDAWAYAWREAEAESDG